MKWFKVRYIDSAINTVEVGSETGNLSVSDATEAIREALEASDVYVNDIAIVSIKEKG